MAVHNLWCDAEGAAAFPLAGCRLQAWTVGMDTGERCRATSPGAVGCVSFAGFCGSFPVNMAFSRGDAGEKTVGLIGSPTILHAWL